MTQLTKSESFLLALEAERHDLSYLNPPKRNLEPLTKTVILRPNPKARQARDKMLFNAGRYAAGCRDKTAVAAHEKLEKELS